MTAPLDVTIRQRASLPPEPRLPPLVQLVLRIWRFGEFRKRCCARYRDTFTLRVGSSQPLVFTKDREAIRRLLPAIL